MLTYAVSCAILCTSPEANAFGIHNGESMRLIEQQMIDAIKQRKDWKKDNTRIETINYNNTYVCSNVYLHNNLICVIGTNQVEVYDGGWQSNTTKSRLNAIINGLCDGRMFGVFQKNYQWFIKDAVVNVEFENGYTLPCN